MKTVRLLKLTLIIATMLNISEISCQDNDSIYEVKQITDRVWTTVENKTVNIYLIEGKDSTLVIDAGYGNGDLKSVIKKITKQPLILVNTHGHYDHIGGDFQFSKVYVHPNDSDMVRSSFNKQKARKFLSYKLHGAELDSAVAKATFPEIVPVKEGYVFDIGNRKFEVIEVPGHTKGSICLLDKDNKILFAGDNTNAVVWLFLSHCLPLETYLQSLKKVEKRIDDFDKIMPGHNEPLKKTFIKEQIVCVEKILTDSCEAKPYNYSEFTKGAMIYKYKSAQVAYDPNKLFEKKD